MRTSETAHGGDGSRQRRHWVVDSLVVLALVGFGFLGVTLPRPGDAVAAPALAAVLR